MVSYADIKTYTRGPYFERRTQLTKDGMVKLCRKLEARFGDGNSFEPHAVGNGFIHWTEWPGKTEGRAYKCMRQWPTQGTRNEWPIVDRDAMTSWVGSKDVALKSGKYTTVLKAFYAAPAWTMDELHTIKECLEDEGFNVDCIPSLAAAGKGLKERAEAAELWARRRK